MSQDKVLSFTGVPLAKDFQGSTGTPIIVDTLTGNLYVKLDSGTVVQIPIFVAAVNDVPTGTIFDFGGTATPTGYLPCDGASVLRASFAALFTAIGTTWGSVDGTHFNVPNLNRRATIGSGGAGTGTIGNAVGNTGGAETHTLLTAEMPSHTHASPTGFPLHTDNTTGLTDTGGVYYKTTNDGQLANTGGGGAHNNMQPAAVVLKIIKT